MRLRRGTARATVQRVALDGFEAGGARPQRLAWRSVSPSTEPFFTTPHTISTLGTKSQPHHLNPKEPHPRPAIHNAYPTGLGVICFSGLSYTCPLISVIHWSIQ